MPPTHQPQGTRPTSRYPTPPEQDRCAHHRGPGTTIPEQLSGRERADACADPSQSEQDPDAGAHTERDPLCAEQGEHVDHGATRGDPGRLGQRDPPDAWLTPHQAPAAADVAQAAAQRRRRRIVLSRCRRDRHAKDEQRREAVRRSIEPEDRLGAQPFSGEPADRRAQRQHRRPRRHHERVRGEQLGATRDAEQCGVPCRDEERTEHHLERQGRVQPHQRSPASSTNRNPRTTSARATSVATMSHVRGKRSPISPAGMFATAKASILIRNTRPRANSESVRSRTMTWSAIVLNQSPSRLAMSPAQSRRKSRSPPG